MLKWPVCFHDKYAKALCLCLLSYVLMLGRPDLSSGTVYACVHNVLYAMIHFVSKTPYFGVVLG